MLTTMNSKQIAGDRPRYHGYTENFDLYHELGVGKWFAQPKGPRPLPEHWVTAAA